MFKRAGLNTQYSILSTSHIVVFLFAITLLFSACEKNIDVNFPPGEQPYVIEGYIENDVVPIVSISRGVSFLKNISNEDFRDLFVTNADVAISIDGGAWINLDPIDLGGAVIYTNTSISGEVGKKYDLKVEVDGKLFTATTTILPSHPLDSISIKTAPGDKGIKDSLVELTAWFSDPIQKDNFYRMLTRKNSEFFFDVAFNSIYNDLLINGQQTSFTIFGGKQQLQNNDSADFSQYGYFKRGDTVYVKWASIDKAQFDFWDSFESQSGSFGNPFAPTVIINSNIKGEGVLGIWASYGAFIDTVYIPE
jgi:hypothetical protein